MLKPQVTATREVVSLDGVWNFAILTDVPEEESEWTKLLSTKTQIPVPASYNDIFLEYDIRNHVGWVKYQRLVRVPRGWSDQRYFVRSDAATHRGRIYINDNLVVDHQGGYTPFDAEVTDLAEPGEEFRLTITVSNELTNETIPPGFIEVLSNGKKKQRYLHDFFNYSGLARSVWLHSVPREHIDDVTITTDVADNGSGIINYQVATHADPNRPSDTTIEVSVTDEEGNTVAQTTGPENRLEIPDVHLWQPGAAYLYQVTVDLHAPNSGPPIDTYTISTGVRTIKVHASQFLINNKPFYFTGFGKHEDTPIRGKGHDPAYMLHDFHLMDWLGANSLRTSHYPYAEEVLTFADHHGIVVIDETPAVGLNLSIASGLFGSDSPPTFSPDTINDNTRTAHEHSIRELIARDKNHPSVVLWCIANEPASHEPGAREYFAPLVHLTRTLDPTRPISFSNFALATAEKDRISDLFDVLCLNRYYGWYEHTGDLSMAEMLLEDDLRAWQAKYGKPIVMTEYGADAVAGLHSAHLVPWSEEFQVDMLGVYHRVFDRVEGVVGEQIWNFADFQTSAFVFRVDGNKKGVFTRDRRPKSAARALRQRWKVEGKGRSRAPEG